jgi:hypothetical protein
MSPESAVARLTQLILTLAPDAASRECKVALIRSELLKRSAHITSPDFTAIHTNDLKQLFEGYDREFCDGLCRSALDGRALGFRLVSRLSKSAGVTRRILHRRSGEVSYDIGIATTMLFDGFGPDDRETQACGLPCRTRLDALQHVFEHELLHLIEFLCWNRSKCSGRRFQEIAARVFGHNCHTHNLITRRERAAGLGIRPGTPVSFVFEGRVLQGVVNRITQRATVLVEDAAGLRYSNGRRYLKYYVPVGTLTISAGPPLQN